MNTLLLSYILDQSHWNGRCYYPVAKQAGAIATFIRFGSINNSTGVCYDDYLINDNVADCKQYNFPFGAYFYLRPKFDGNLQGNYFVNLLNKHKPQLPAVIDVEEVGDYKNVIKACQKVVSAGYKGEIYTRQTIWDYNFPADPYWKTVKLFAARWTSAPLDSPWGDGKCKFRDWSEWNYWQFSADGNARAVEFGFLGYPHGDNDIDLSYYNGTLEQFNREYGLDSTVPPTNENTYIVTTQGLYIRQEPYVGATILGQRNVSEEVIPIDYGGKDLWVRDGKGWSAVQINSSQYMKRK